MDTGLWQFALACILIGLFYARPIGAWIREHWQRKAVFPLGYTFATFCALVGILFYDATSPWRPLPRFDDIFLIGIAATAYLFRSKPATYLLALALALCAWVLPPENSFAITNPLDQYRMASFAIVSVLMIFAITRLKGETKSWPASLGYVFATLYSVLGATAITIAFQGQPVPRFNDVFVVGIAITAYFFSALPAAYLLTLSVAITMWILPPAGSLRIVDADDYYRVFSFIAVSAFTIVLMDRLKRRVGKFESVPTRG